MTDILRIQHEAQRDGFDSAKFYISAPKGVFEAQWLDAYFGFFRIPSVSEDSLSVNSFPTESWEAFRTKEEADEHNEKFSNLQRFFELINPENEADQ